MIYVKEAKGFKEGDGGIGPMKGSSDAYVTFSWGKFGKTISSTRIIEKDQNPEWHEWAYMLVSPEEINADEKLKSSSGTATNFQPTTTWDESKFL